MEDFERIVEEARRLFEEDFKKYRVRAMGCIEPLYNIVEREEEIRISVDLPGVEKEDIKLTLHEDSIVVEGVCKKITPTVRRLSGGKPLYYSVRIPLPTKVEEDSARARYSNGILEIILMKRKRGRRIPIE
ncbi:MAG: Hsp20/alpha crystallin family protein [Thermoproteota archaeon]|nr:Hsp20/alpha crystallin family protein [Candidatus Brockarchaeota archaeon]